MVTVLLVFIAGVALADVTEITIWHTRREYIPVDRYEEFHAANPHIRINYDAVPWEEQFSAYLRAFVVGNAPDIFHLEHGVIPMLAEQGMVKDMTAIKTMWEEENPDDFQDLAPLSWTALAYDGVIYGMGQQPFTRQLNYRIDLYEEAGLDAPVYWDEVLDNARKLRTDDMLGYAQEGSRLAMPEKTYNMYQQMGGQFPGNVIQLDSEAGIAVLDFLQTIMREGLAHPDTLSWDHAHMRAAFIEGNTAQNFMGAHMYPLVQQNFEYNVDWAIVPLVKRRGAEDEATFGANVFGYILSSQSEAPLEDIMKVLQHLASPDIMAEINWDYAPGIRASVYHRPEFVENLPWWDDVLLEAIAFAEAFPVHPKSPLMYEIIHDARQEALSDPDVDVAEMAARHQAAINALLD